MKLVKGMVTTLFSIIFMTVNIANATTTVTGDYNGDGNQDSFNQADDKGGTSSLTANAGGTIANFHISWTDAHPDISEIEDWSAHSYGAFSANLNSSPGDELLLLGKKEIILLHGDIITPILIPKDVQNAIVYWGSNGVATYSSFDADVDPDSVEVKFGDFDGDGDNEVFLQSNSTGGTSYIINGNGTISQTLTNGYLGIDWSTESSMEFIDQNGDGRLDLTITDANGNVTVIYASATGTFTDTPVAITPSWAKVTSAEVPDATIVAPVIPVQVSVGALKGQASVSGGAASYSIPIALPPGRKGMQPSVSLNYSSRSGNGITGVGWSLSANSSISRCGALADIDIANLGVQYDSEFDRLCLDGKRLINVSGVYGEINTRYRTELDEFVEVIQRGGEINSLNSYFEIRDRDNNTNIYGNNTLNNNSKVVHEGAPAAMSWLLDTVRDTSGNAIHFSYLIGANSGEVVLETVKYTGTSDGVNEVVGDRQVTFSYDSTRTDVSSGYLAGGFFRNTLRLNKISTSYNSETIREYNLDYKYSGASSKSLLQSVEECAYDQSLNKSCLSKTEFDWSDNEISYELKPFTLKQTNNTIVSPFAPDHKGVAVDFQNIFPRGDINGDGVKDWLDPGSRSYGDGSSVDFDGFFFNAEGEQANSHNFTSSSKCSDAMTVQIASRSCVFADFNLDGRTDTWSGSTTSSIKLNYTELDVNGNPYKGAAIDTGIETQKDYSNDSALFFGYTQPSLIPDIADFNGDGYPDLLIYNQRELRIHLHNGLVDGSNPYDSGGILFHAHETKNFTGKLGAIIVRNIDGVQSVGDIDGNGLPDYIVTDTYDVENEYFYPVPRPTKLKLTHRNQSGLYFTFQDLTAYTADAKFYKFFDINSDGLSDYLYWNGGSDTSFRLNKGDGTFGDAINLGSTLGPIRSYRISSDQDAKPLSGLFAQTLKYAAGIRVTDLNGDGRLEILIPNERIIESCYFHHEYPFGGGGHSQRWFCGDELYGRYREQITVGINNYRYVFNEMPGAQVDEGIYQYDAIFIDENLDGTFSIRTEDSGIQGPISQGAFVDVYGNGLTDFVFTYGPRNESVLSKIESSESSNHSILGVDFDTYVFANSGSAGQSSYEPIDMLKKATSGVGVFDLASEWSYMPLSTGRKEAGGHPLYLNDYDATDADPDYFHFTSSMYVVSSFREDNGVGSTTETEYRYKGAMYNNKGRGFQGFNQIVVDNYDSQIRSVTDFSQKFPFTGKIDEARSCLTSSDANCDSGVFDKTTITYFAKNTANDEVYWIVPSETIETKFDRVSQNTVSEKSTSILETNVDEYGNVEFSTTEILNGYSTVKVTTDNNYTNDSSAWWFKLDDSTVTTETVSGSALHEVELDPKKSIKTTYTYYNSSRLPNVVTVDSLLDEAITTSVDTDYNAFGLPTKVTTIAGNESRSIDTTYSKDGESESADGYFAYKVTNDLNHFITTKTFPEHGQVSEITNANGQSTSTSYDPFGRVEQVTPPTNTGQPAYSRFAECIGGCDGVTAILPTDLTDSGISDMASLITYKVTTYSAGAPEATLYKDKFNRVLFAKTEGFNGSSIFVRTEYDSLGRKIFESVPSFSVDEDKGVHWEDFDPQGRLVKKTMDEPELFGAPQSFTTTYVYSDHLTTILATGSSGRTLSMSRVYAGNGQLMKTTDAINGVTEYAYDSQGNPIVLEDAKDNAITATYNAFGQKLYVIDPNMGRKDFTYTPFGEVDTETDAKAVVTDYDYDVLGRLTTRTAANVLEASFYYDSAAKGTTADKCIGAIDSEYRGGPGSDSFNKQYSYDNYCRPSAVVTNIDGTPYTQATQYDGYYGRVKGIETVTGLTIENVYNSRGYITQSKNASSGYVYQEVTDMDARLQWTVANKADGQIVETREYTHETGQMALVKAMSGSQSQRHRIAYEYDDFGNLDKQFVEEMLTDLSVLTFEESYEYDDLHRLTESSRLINGQDDTLTYDYDAVGNILIKDDFSTDFTYGDAARSNGNAGPNAVQRVVKTAELGSEVVTYGYDLNGNMTSGDGRTITYNAFNKPLSIAKGGITSWFSYGADQMRYKQVKTGLSNGTETTIYIDKSYEEISQNGVTVKRSYLGDTILTETVGGSEAGFKIGFVHRDRLGSVVTITDETGKVVDNKSFDPFGKVRKGNMEQVDPDNLATLSVVAELGGYDLQTNRGFTDHEHLDDAELIHMNGRVYDYNLGRFLSVDPFIQEPGNSQSMNPYSYGMNNPMAGTDPSGYLFFLVPAIVKGVMWGMTAYAAYETAEAAVDTLEKFDNGEISGQDALVAVGEVALEKAVLRKAEAALHLVPDVVKDKAGDALNKAKDKVVEKFNGNNKNTKTTDNDSSSVGDKPNEKNPGGCSFTSGTLVAIPGGFEEIQNISVGDLVKAKNDQTDEIENKKVNAVFDELHEEVIEVTVALDEGKIEVITTTAEHPFMLYDGDWLPAGKLKVGAFVESLNGLKVEIIGLVVIKESQVAYNFEVDEFHTYAVGEGELWVHNECDKTVNADGKTIDKVSHADNFDKAREQGMKNSGLDKADKVEFTKVDPKTGTVVEFKGSNGSKVNYDSPHKDMDSKAGHDKPHVGWQTGGKRKSGGAGRGNITHDDNKHPTRPDEKEK